jgi:hypothetical protein
MTTFGFYKPYLKLSFIQFRVFEFTRQKGLWKENTVSLVVYRSDKLIPISHQGHISFGNEG